MQDNGHERMEKVKAAIMRLPDNTSGTILMKKKIVAGEFERWVNTVLLTPKPLVFNREEWLSAIDAIKPREDGRLSRREFVRTALPIFLGGVVGGVSQLVKPKKMDDSTQTLRALCNWIGGGAFFIGAVITGVAGQQGINDRINELSPERCASTMVGVLDDILKREHPILHEEMFKRLGKDRPSAKYRDY